MQAERARIIAEAAQTIRRGSKSFALASRLYDRPTRERAWLLYAWCRHCDDVCDNQADGHDAAPVRDGAARLAYLREETERALDGLASRHSAFEGLRIVTAECRLPRALVRDHLRGFAMDIEAWRPLDERDLLAYCYHVAGVVGCMMALVMGVARDDEETLDRACDLGIAFQLANIARDLLDDHAVGRCYLPADWLAQAQLTPSSLGDTDKRHRLATLAARLTRLSAQYEASGRAGAFRLPFRSRWAVLAAADIYGAIARLVEERGTHAWDRRAVIGVPYKLGSVVGAWRDARRHPPVDVRPRELWTRPRASQDMRCGPSAARSA